MNYKTLYRKLKIAQHELGCHRREAVPVPLVLVDPVV